MFELMNTPVPEFLGMSRDWADALTAIYTQPAGSAHNISCTLTGIELEVYNNSGTLIYSHGGTAAGAGIVVSVPVAAGTTSLRFRTKVRADFDLNDNRIALWPNLKSGGAGNTFNEISNWEKAKLRRLTLDWAEQLQNVPSKISPNLWTMSFINNFALNHPNINVWDTSNLRSFGFMFAYCTSFNRPLFGWNTSNVTSLDFMFAGCTKMNTSISAWNISKVTTMQSMFAGANIYNQNLSSMIFKSTVNRTNYDSGTTAWLAQNKPKFTGV